jgi:hypothetical protein
VNDEATSTTVAMMTSGLTWNSMPSGSAGQFGSVARMLK